MKLRLILTDLNVDNRQLLSGQIYSQEYTPHHDLNELKVMRTVDFICLQTGFQRHIH